MMIEINQMCRMLVEELRPTAQVELRLATALADDVRLGITQGLAVCQVLEQILRHAIEQHSRDGSFCAQGYIAVTVTDDGTPGYVTFAVSDTSRHVTTPSIDLREAVHLVIHQLKGHIWVDPFYRDGTRVVFDTRMPAAAGERPGG